MKIGFLIDPLETLNPKTDTSLLLMETFLDLGHEVYEFTPSDLCLNPDNSIRARSVDIKNGKINSAFPSVYPLSFLDICLIRKDPPVDENYFTFLQMLTLEEDLGRVLFVNSASGLLRANEKLWGMRLKHLLPPTLVSSNLDQMIEFRRSQAPNPVIFKPINGYASKGVLLLKPEDELVIDPSKYWIVQEYLPSVHQGDRRVFLLNGKIAGAISRVPEKGEFRCAISLGASVVLPELTKQEIAICEEVGSLAQKDGILFAGLDLIGEKLIEVNVTSPTAVRQYIALSQDRLDQKICETILQKAKGRS